MKLFLSILLLCSISLFAQERWIPDGRSMPKPPLGQYNSLPENIIPWKNINSQVRYFYSQNEVLAVSPNIRVLPNSNQQDEIILVRNPVNPLIMFGSANTTVGSTFGQGAYITTNGGTSWFGTDVIPSFTFQTSDPGPTIDKNGVIIMTTLNVSGTARMYSSYSTNNGTSWSSALQMTSASSDKNFAATDDISSSPYYGRSYCVWSNFALSSPPIVFSFTTNGAQSWSSPTQINTPPSGHYSQGCDIIVGPNGNVYVCWAAPVSGGSYTEDYLGFARSTNGGASWIVTENAYDMNGIRSSSFNGWGVRVNGFPRIGVDKSGGSRNGWIYVVTSEVNLAPAGSDADVILHRSTDGGTTWSAGVRVNQDTPNNGKVQFFPAIRVDEQGGVNVVFYDNRNYPSVGDSCETFVARSNDGGNTWTEVIASDHRWKVKGEPGAGNYMGDYIGITSGNNKVWPFWFDDKSGSMQAWTCSIDIGPPPAHDIVCGPFLSLPGSFIAGNTYTIKTKVTNIGTSNETGVPVKFWINTTLTNTTNINLTAGQTDSVSNSWTPSSAGTYTLTYASALTTDENRSNDTVRTTVTVQPPGLVPYGTTVCRNGLMKQILDNQTTRDTINYNDPLGYGIVDVNVKVDTVTHTWDSDLSFTITHGATSVSLISGRGGSGDNFIGCILNDSASQPISSGTAPFTGSWRPESPLSAFNTQGVNGQWILSITDNALADQGYLKAWCIQLTYLRAVGGIITVEIPNYYSLQQNYPNPFNPVTKLTYTLPKSGNVKLVVYDVLGREVRTLVDETKGVGVYRLDFDGSNIASGIYFYRLDVTDGASGNVVFTDVKKMMLVK
jgi:hypothetical protein